MDFRIVLKLLGGLLVFLGLIVLAPGVYSGLSGGHLGPVFFLTGGSAMLVGVLLYATQSRYRAEPGHRTGFAIVSVSWLSACLVGALPYYLSATLTSFIDCFFESTSGFSGTGASVINNIEGVDPAIVLWRSMTQWLGGMGIIVFFIAILPFLGLGSVQLFRAEVTGPSKEKITPRVRETAKKLWMLYIFFTVVCGLTLYLIGDMTPFDSVNHALTALATGGFSTKNTGIAAFNSATIEYILTLFMLVASINFGLHYRFLAMRDGSACFDTELKWYLNIVVGMTVVFTLSTWGTNYEHFETAFRKSFFIVAATASSTGFSNADYLMWPVVCHYLIVLLMVMGGMSGSTAGGVKCIRLVAAFKQFSKELKQIVHPKAILSVKANEQSLAHNVVSAIWGFLFLYFFVFSVATFLLVIYDLDLTTASTAVFSALSNIGPALGGLGPTSTYSSLQFGPKIILSLCMILGRLEFYTVLVIFTITYWRK